MIQVTRIDGTPIVINADVIQSVERTPDTLITLTTGARVLVRDPVEAVIRAFKDYQREVRARVPGEQA